MASSSFSSSMQSYSEPFTQEQEMILYKGIKMHLQEIQIVTQDINQQFKNIQEEMLVTAALINAIESKNQGN